MHTFMLIMSSSPVQYRPRVMTSDLVRKFESHAWHQTGKQVNTYVAKMYTSHGRRIHLQRFHQD